MRGPLAARYFLGRAAARSTIETTIRNGNMELEDVVGSSSHTRQVCDCTVMVNHTGNRQDLL
jgi:hypothetical protein